MGAEIKRIANTDTFEDIVDGVPSTDGSENMHPVAPAETRRMNRAERRAKIKEVLSRDERLLFQELKRDVIKALVKPKGLSKAQLRRRRRKDAKR
jgi:hypothetical protein